MTSIHRSGSPRQQRMDVLETIGYDVRPHALQSHLWVWVGPIVMSRYCFPNEDAAIDAASSHAVQEVRAKHGLTAEQWAETEPWEQRDLLLGLVEVEDAPAERMAG